MGQDGVEKAATAEQALWRRWKWADRGVGGGGGDDDEVAMMKVVMMKEVMRPRDGMTHVSLTNAPRSLRQGLREGSARGRERGPRPFL